MNTIVLRLHFENYLRTAGGVLSYLGILFAVCFIFILAWGFDF